MKTLLLLTCSLFTCGYTCFSNKLTGYWVLADKAVINYPGITFYKDSTAIFTSKGDTIYRYRYELKENGTIELTDTRGKKYINAIIKLNNDSLVFDGLAGQEKELLYIKKKG